MSSTKKGGSASTASGVDERTETYKSATTEATSTTRFGDDVYSYTRVSKISKGFFDNDDLALRHYDEAKDTFTALEAAYKRLLLQVEASKQERRYEVNFIYMITQNILKMPFIVLVYKFRRNGDFHPLKLKFLSLYFHVTIILFCYFTVRLPNTWLILLNLWLFFKTPITQGNYVAGAENSLPRTREVWLLNWLSQIQNMNIRK